MATTHGESRTPEYRVWSVMKHRCLSPRAPLWPYYGARGITVCERWMKYENFIADMGHRPTPHHTLDRQDNDGPYTKENCRWVTMHEQSNNKRSTVLLTFAGKTQSAAEWNQKLGFSENVVGNRINMGWSVVRALTQPMKWRKQRGEHTM